MSRIKAKKGRFSAYTDNRQFVGSFATREEAEAALGHKEEAPVVSTFEEPEEVFVEETFEEEDAEEEESDDEEEKKGWF